MTRVRSTYLPGHWVAVSAPDSWLLVDLPPDSEVVRRCWDLLYGGAGADDVLDALIASGIRSTPSFALLRMAADERRVVVRGDAVASVRGGDALVEHHGGSRVWTDERVDGSAAEVRLSGAGSRGSAGASVPLPMASGVMLAGEVVVSFDDETAADDSTAPIPPAIVISAPPAPQAHTDADSGADDVVHAEPDVDAGPVLDVPSAPDVLALPEVDATPSYDFLFGATQRPPDLSKPDPARVADRTAGWNTMIGVRGENSPAEGDAEPAVAAAAEVVPPAPQTPGVIDALPWATAPAAAAPPDPPARAPEVPPDPPAAVPAVTPDPPAPVRAVTPDPPARAPEVPPDPVQVVEPDADPVVARTTNRAALLAELRESQAVVGPTVLAGHCPNGHVSPAHAAACRVCGAAMPAQQPVEIARPALGVLRLSTGDVVSLDRGVLLGRAPEASAEGDERPHLVQLVSPENDVSRNHAEIVLDGWHVYVRDLGSTNGTTVTLPGQAPVRLRENDLQLLDNGSVVTLADEVSCTFEVTG